MFIVRQGGPKVCTNNFNLTSDLEAQVEAFITSSGLKTLGSDGQYHWVSFEDSRRWGWGQE